MYLAISDDYVCFKLSNIVADDISFVYQSGRFFTDVYHGPIK